MDCWTYNEGCSTFGCSATLQSETVPVASQEAAFSLTIPEEAGVPLSVVFLTLLVLSLSSLFFLLFSTGSAALLTAFLSIASWMHLKNLVSRGYLSWGFGSETQPTLLENESVEQREKKSILALLGSGMTPDLAVAYALFEQRHPRARLPLKAQLSLAQELAREGFTVFAAEALEKCFSRTQGQELSAIRTVYAALFRKDPAYFAEASGQVPQEASQSPAPLKVFPLQSEQEHYLVSLSPHGFPLAFRGSYTLPTEKPGTPVPYRSLVLGPFPFPEIQKMRSKLLRAGYTSIPLMPSEFGLPAVPLEVEVLTFTSKGARFSGHEFDCSFPWSEVQQYFYERIESKTERSTLVAISNQNGRKDSLPRFGEKTTEETEYISILEVHAGVPLQRFRIRYPYSKLFDYLGRRRTYSFETNLRLTAKDLARFAPKARASRFTLAMFSERQSKEPKLQTLEELEERIHWFTALGLPRVKRWWNSE